MFKKNVVLTINLLLFFVILVLLPIMIIIVVDIKISSLYGYLTQSNSITIGGEEVNLPSGYYISYHRKPSDIYESFILIDIFNNSVLVNNFVGEYDYTTDSSCISEFNETIRKFNSYGVYGTSRLYRLSNYEIYLYSNILIQKSFNVVNVYHCVIPYNRMKFTYVGLDDEDYVINSIIKHIAFNKIDGDIKFIEDLEEL